MHLKRKIIVIISVTLFSGAILFGGIPYALFTNMTTVPLSELTWEKDPSVLALAPVTRDGKKGTLTIRLSDGDDHFFEGSARVFHMSDNSLVLVPQDIPQDYKGEVPLYYVEHGRKVFKLTFAYHFGNIINVTENAQRSYLAIESKNKKSTQFCIIERITDGKQPSCQQVGVSLSLDSLWNPNHEHEFLIQTSSSEIITFDPWEKGPVRVRADGDAKRFADLLVAFNQKQKPNVFPDGSLYRFFSIVLRTTPNGWRIIGIPPFSHTRWLSDIEHIIVQEGERLSVVEYGTNRKSEVNITSSNASLQ